LYKRLLGEASLSTTGVTNAAHWAKKLSEAKFCPTGHYPNLCAYDIIHLYVIQTFDIL